MANCAERRLLHRRHFGSLLLLVLGSRGGIVLFLCPQPQLSTNP